MNTRGSIARIDEAGQPTQKIIELRRGAKFITPIPKPKKRKAAAQTTFIFNEGKGLSNKEQQYDPTSIINEVRGHVDSWRSLPNPSQWQVAPETIRLLQHWRHHKFSGVRPFFCQVEAVETAIWLTSTRDRSRERLPAHTFAWTDYTLRVFAFIPTKLDVVAHLQLECRPATTPFSARQC